jgi:hypothetical protein
MHNYIFLSLGHIKKKLVIVPAPIFFFIYLSFFLAFFHILMQSEKYIFEKTFGFVVHLNQSRFGV